MARCTHCKKKMGLMEFTCQCTKKFCNKCLMPELHNCSYDFRSQAKENLKTSLVKVINEKVIKI